VPRSSRAGEPNTQARAQGPAGSRTPARAGTRRLDAGDLAEAAGLAHALQDLQPMTKIAFLVGEDFEDSEFRKPYDALRQAGFEIDVLGVKPGEAVRGKKQRESVTIERAASAADPGSYEAIVIPGGYSPDHLRMDRGVVDFVSKFARSGKLVAAVCHGPQLLIEADVVAGKRLTSWPSVRKDLENARATWVDQQVVVDDSLITSRKPDDLPAFADAIKAWLADPAKHRRSEMSRAQHQTTR
jgi:protease I